MKWCMVVVCLSAALRCTHGAALPEEKKSIDIFTVGDGEELKRSGEIMEVAGGERLKRSGGSGDILGYIGSKIGSKIQAFASASAGLSSSSSHPKPEYGPPSHEAKNFDFWTFKKALLSTLLQAVKAIKGGVIALKGSIIKAKGNILATKGRIISAKGEAISNLGKHIASTALMLDKHPPAHPPPHPPVHPPSAPSAEYGIGPTGGSSGFGGTGSYSPSGSGTGSGSYSSGYDGPPPPSTSYGVPSGPSSLYGAPFKRGGAPASAKSSSLPSGVHAGLLVVKPIPGSSSRSNSYTSSLHDFFGSPSHPIAAFVAAPAPFGPAPAQRRSSSSSYSTADQDFSIYQEYNSPYDI